MTTAFESVFIHLEKLGFFELLPFILSSAFFYGLLRKSKLFGDPEKNVAVNATVAVAISFMIWAYPFLTGISLHEYELMFSTFFFKSLVATLVIIFGLMIVSMFAPEGLNKMMKEKFGKNFWIGVIVFGLIVAFLIFLSSTISKVFLPNQRGISSETKDLIYSIIVMVALVGIVALVVWASGKEEKQTSAK